jgi:hypothetical protein
VHPTRSRVPSLALAVPKPNPCWNASVLKCRSCRFHQHARLYRDYGLLREHLAAARLGRSPGALGAVLSMQLTSEPVMPGPCGHADGTHGAGGGPSNVTPRSFANSANIAGAGAAPPVARTTS